MLAKITVIADKAGNIVATQVGHGEAAAASGPVTSLVAGPGQILHKIELEMPRFTCRADIDAFHRRVAQHLRGK